MKSIALTALIILSTISSLNAKGVEINGAWTGPCTFFSNTSMHGSAKFSDSEVLIEYFTYIDRYCEQPVHAYRYFRSYGIPNVQGSFTSIDYTVVRVEEVVLTNRFVELSNETEACGFSNWKLGIPKDVTGRKCGSGDPHPEAGIMIYDIYKVINGFLYFGQMNQSKDGSSPERRPVLLDDEYIMARNKTE